MNISEFAAKAGVSKSAVSRYFNNGYLSDEKRELIEKTIKETGYTPKLSARSARITLNKQIGIIIPKLSNESTARVVDGISAVLNAHGYQLLLLNTENDYRNEITALELFRKSHVDGVILLATVFTDLHRRMLGKMHKPVVIVGQDIKGCSCVYHDDFNASYSVTKLMLDKGAKKPGFIGVLQEDIAAGMNRRLGFERAVKDAGLTINKRFIDTSDFNMDSGYKSAERILSGSEMPDCLFCATDTIAIGVMLFCREHGIRIPCDMMISAIGDTKLGRIAYSPLTSAHLHYKTAGIDAAEMLLTEIKHNSPVRRTLKLDYEMVERESTAKA